MEEKLEILDAQSRHVGKECSRCGKELAVDDEAVECPRCHRVHHADCWKDNGGCARRGCPQVAKAVVGERSAGDGPPPPISPQRLLIAVGVVIALIIVSIISEISDPASAGSSAFCLGFT